MRVHKEILGAQQLPKELVDKGIWEKRYADINNFEKYLPAPVVLNFFCTFQGGTQRFGTPGNVGQELKFSMADIRSGFWKDYQNVYQEMIQNNATKHAPWYVIPADNKMATRLAVASAAIEALNSLDLQFPEVDQEKKKELAKVREALLKGKD